jgi:pimeloyl-ACP methyl ester carboxylesterase
MTETLPATLPLRPLEDVKKEVLRRAAHINPFEGIKREDAAAIVAALTSLDPDHWADLWCKTGFAYEAEGDALVKKGGDVAQIGRLFQLAFHNCRIARYPVASTPGKRAAYAHSVRLYRKAAQYFESPVQVIELPFEGATLTGYLQLPHGVQKPPVVMHWGGVDGRKEDRLGPSAALRRHGLASLAVDMPGTGDNPVPYLEPRAERTFAAFIDHLQTRHDLDGARIGVWGGSYGAYWAAKLAYVEAARLKGAVFHGGNVHYGFQREWLVPALTQNAATYLFGPASLFEARSQAMGVTTLEEFLQAAPGLSLLTQGLLDRPSAPILGINGKKDDQAPVADVYLLMEHGGPKAARIYAEGGHMGRTPGMDSAEITDLIAGWLGRRLAQ